MGKIQVLDKHTAELIAAGEVVERPASVVKELFENAVDAGATAVTVEIENGGVTLLRITDNGCGIAREDVPTAFLRHATSKVRTADDLEAIGTLGFRGEALASVAAVARVELITRTAEETAGTRYVIEGGEERLCEDAGCPVGTTFTVADLFYNVPARMKFLKKDVGEANAVAGVMDRLALSHPEVAVRFVRDGREALLTPGDGDIRSCIYAVFGREFTAGLIPLDYTEGGVHVSGFINRLEYSRPNRTMQHFFVNGRYVRTRTAMAALEQAYKGSIMVGRFPTCVMYITLPPQTVDVNVHPAKIEVRFVNEKPLFDAVYHGVKSALEACTARKAGTLPAPAREPESPPAAQLRFAESACRAPETSAPSASPAAAASLASSASSAPAASASPATPPAPAAPAAPGAGITAENVPISVMARFREDPPSDLLHDGGAKEWGAYRMRPDIECSEPIVPDTRPRTAPAPSAPPAASPVPQPEPPAAVSEPEAPPPAIRIVGEAFETYIFAEMNGELYVIDKHAAHERLLYNALRQTPHTEAQQLLSPVSVRLSAEEYTALLDASEELRQAGFDVEDFGGSEVLVRGIPMLLCTEDPAAVICEVAGGLAAGRREITTDRLDWLYHNTACRAAVKAGNRGTPAERQRLAEEVLWDDSVRTCPHGRPVCFVLTRREIEKQFGRVK